MLYSTQHLSISIARCSIVLVLAAVSIYIVLSVSVSHLIFCLTLYQKLYCSSTAHRPQAHNGHAAGVLGWVSSVPDFLTSCEV
jgi:hypothetical protein